MHQQINTDLTVKAATVVHIAFVVDERNILPLAAAAKGLVEHLRSGWTAVLHIVHVADAAVAVGRLRPKLEATGSVNVLPIQLEDAALLRFPPVGHVPQISYARLLLPHLLPNLRRVIYMDCDVLVCADVAYLWEHDIAGYPLGAVVDIGIRRLDSDNCLSYCRNDLSNPSAKAFNAGILVIDLDSWRRTNVEDRAETFVRTYHDKLYSADQDVLNFIFAEGWKALSPRWNVPQFQLRAFNPPACDSPDLVPFHNADITDGCIYHFYGPQKPWNSWVTHPARDAWYAALKRSNWFSPAQWVIWRILEEIRAIRFSITARIFR